MGTLESLPATHGELCDALSRANCVFGCPGCLFQDRFDRFAEENGETHQRNVSAAAQGIVERNLPCLGCRPVSEWAKATDQINEGGE